MPFISWLDSKSFDCSEAPWVGESPKPLTDLVQARPTLLKNTVYF